MDIIVLLVACWNQAGAICDFPFDYKGKMYFSCTKDGPNGADQYTRPWCYDKRGNGQLYLQMKMPWKAKQKKIKLSIKEVPLPLESIDQVATVFDWVEEWKSSSMEAHFWM